MQEEFIEFLSSGTVKWMYRRPMRCRIRGTHGRRFSPPMRSSPRQKRSRTCASRLRRNNSRPPWHPGISLVNSGSHNERSLRQSRLPQETRYILLHHLVRENPYRAVACNAGRASGPGAHSDRDEAPATQWLDDLHETNSSAYRRGIRRRARNIGSDVVREDPGRLEQVLHPNARALIDRIVASGTRTIILDECHHLLDHWALVLQCLIAAFRRRGIEPLVIGLTATLPSAEDEEAYENYTALVGEVDYELPTPAVVKEGNLAPYRSFAWFVTPSEEELDFLRNHERKLRDLIETTLATDEGISFLESWLQPDPDENPNLSADQRLAVAFKEDPEFAVAAARMLQQVAPERPLRAALGDDARTRPTVEQQIRVLARYALNCILPDPQRTEAWQHIRHTLVDFGYTLTGRRSICASCGRAGLCGARAT